MVVDDYRWLEEESAAVQDWEDIQNERTERWLGAGPWLNRVRGEVGRYLEPMKLLAPIAAGNFWFTTGASGELIRSESLSEVLRKNGVYFWPGASEIEDG